MKKLPHIFFMQTFGILLVVLGHSFFRFPSDYPLLQWMYAFHMPLFFFLSGYLLRYMHPEPERVALTGRGGYLTRRARRLLLPYVVISSMVFVPKALMGQFAVRPIHLTLHDYIDNIVYPYHNVVAAFWFMPTLFIIMAVFMAMARLHLLRHKAALLAVSLLLYGLVDFDHDSVLNLRGVAHFYVFFAVGYCFRQSRAEDTLARRWPLWATVPATALLSMVAWLPRQSVWLQLCVALNGIALSMCLARLYKRLGLSFLNHLYGATYYIYLFSNLFQILALQVLLHFVALPAVVFVPLAFFSGVYGPWAMYRLRQNMKKDNKDKP